MPSLEMVEIILLIFFPLGIVSMIYAATKRKDVILYIPGFISLFITFICTNLEAVVDEIGAEILNFGEHFFILMTAILLFFAVILDFYGKFLKKKKKKGAISIPRKNVGHRGLET